MLLKDRITADMKDAMRARDAQRLSTIRLLLAAIKQREVDERIELDDDAVIAVVDKLVKQRRDSVQAFRSAARDDLADREQAEIEVLTGYLPARLTDAEIAAEVRTLVAELGAVGPADMGKLMAAAKARFGAKAEMARVSAAVKQVLGSGGARA
jgi:hypothetical protein